MNIQKPTLVHVIAWTTLASGIVNLFWGFAASGTALASFIGAICVPVTILPSVLGIFELIYAAKLFSNPPQAIRPSTNIAVFQIACVLVGNVFSMAVGILSLVFYNDTVVKDYFTSLNGTFSSVPVTVSTPASASPEPASASEESVAASDEVSAAEPSAKPKRSTRKTSDS